MSRSLLLVIDVTQPPPSVVAMLVLEFVLHKLMKLVDLKHSTTDHSLFDPSATTSSSGVIVQIMAESNKRWD